MKISKPKKWLIYARVCMLLVFVFFICASELNKNIISVTKNENLNKAISFNTIIEHQNTSYQSSLYEKISTFSGDLTGYVGNCPKCSGVVACYPRTNVLEQGIIFSDVEYGNVRMVASSRKYPCGTILRFVTERVSNSPIIAIVMDRGVGGNDIDLLVETKAEAVSDIGRVRDLEFEILRVGWE